MTSHATILVGQPTFTTTLNLPQGKRKRGRPRKEQTNMTPNGPNEQKQNDTQKANPVTRTVFDLTEFDDVKLSKPFTPPAKPTTLEEALAAVGNDTAKLMDVIHEGLTSEARNQAYEDINGFFIVNDDGTVTDQPYVGKFADDEKGKLINNAILALAKINGYDKSLPKEKKQALKDKAVSFLRENPAMLASLQG